MCMAVAERAPPFARVFGHTYDRLHAPPLRHSHTFPSRHAQDFGREAGQVTYAAVRPDRSGIGACVCRGVERPCGSLGAAAWRALDSRCARHAQRECRLLLLTLEHGSAPAGARACSAHVEVGAVWGAVGANDVCRMGCRGSRELVDSDPQPIPLMCIDGCGRSWPSLAHG